MNAPVALTATGTIQQEHARLHEFLKSKRCPFTGCSYDGGKTFPEYSLETKLTLLCSVANLADDETEATVMALTRRVVALEHELTFYKEQAARPIPPRILST